MPFKFSIRTSLILIAVIAAALAIIASNPNTQGWAEYGFGQFGAGPVPYLEAYSDLSKSAETLKLRPTEKPSWSTRVSPHAGPNNWFVVNEDDANIWVQVSASGQHFEAVVIGHKDCLPWQDASAERNLSEKTSKKLAAWWYDWQTEHGWR